MVQFVGEQGYCTVTELSALFAVSEMTIRRDITRLMHDGKLRAFHGGVGSLSPQDMRGRDYRDREFAMGDAKRGIALRAVEMVGSNSVIAIDAGTTAALLASLLPTHQKLRVVTPSFPVVSTLVGDGQTEVICLGGVLHSETLSFSGPSTLAAISDLQVEKLFLAASGIGERGAFCANDFDAVTKRALIEVAEHIILVADASKFKMSAMVKICDWNVIDTLVIDSSITAEQIYMLNSHGVEVIVVEPVPAGSHSALTSS